ncbi:MAG: BatA and WFA domain-containing protein [Planctomycetales bacterium]|nr:BatA and WFA domain-containing protein [Planctomycetales bacterium]
MNWLNTLNWWQWSLMALVPPAILALYFLKLKRQPLEVPSTYLWHRTIEDLHVNSIWQRLRQNILLFLQLLLVLLAILACLRPTWQSTQLQDGRVIFLIDTSASMAATDIKPTRLEKAKQDAVNMIESELSSGTAAMVISFSDRAIVEQPFTLNKRQLVNRIKAIQQTQRTSELDEALRVAAGLANPGRSGNEDEGDVAAAEAMPAKLIIMSDGRFQTIPDFAMGNLQPEFVPVGELNAKNIGITAFSSGQSQNDSGKVNVFGQIQNFTGVDADVTANLYLDDRLIDATQIEIAKNGASGVEFTISAVESGELRLEIEASDDFAMDNVAYTAIDPPRRARVLLVTPKNDALEMVMSTELTLKMADVRLLEPAALQGEDYKKQASTAAYDLIIYDQCVPPEMPQANTYFIGNIPSGDRWTSTDNRPHPQVIDVERAHPLMSYVEFGNVTIAESKAVTPPKGGSVLIDSDEGPVLAIAPREGFEDLVQGFVIVGKDDSGDYYSNTNWTIRTSFPVFMGNVVSYLGGVRQEQEQMSIRPGQNMVIRSELPVPEIEVESPSQQKNKIARGPQATFVYSNTEQMGVYRIREADAKEVKQRFAVNLFDPVESTIPVSDILTTKYEQIQGQAVREPARREAWKYLLLLALAILCIEWFIYNRRVYL